MRLPNQYRLVYIRHEYDTVAMKYGREETDGPVVLETHTKWRSWSGESIKCHDSYKIEFRYKENA